MKNLSIPFRRWVSAAIVLVLAGQACTFSLFDGFGSTSSTPAPVIPTSTQYPVALTTFVVTIPEPLQTGETIAVYVLDEVTGLWLNETERYPLNPVDSKTYMGTLPVPVNSVVKYRYVRLVGQSPYPEDTALGVPIRYRLHNAASSSEVHDIVADWSDKAYTIPTGNIKGRVYDVETNGPIPGILVTAGGIQSITDSQGHYELMGLPQGTHQITAYSLDGSYLPFEQGAGVATGDTPADLPLRKTTFVNVTFKVTVPSDSYGRPVRIVGNILQLGNTFSDLQGGVSVSPDRTYTLDLQPNGGYAKTISLPVGTYIEYKYTLGDGYWNAERKLQSTTNNSWVIRKFVVPNQDFTIQDVVDTWQEGSNSGPILFEVAVPSVTPVEDTVYIQFKTFGWMEPIPMWKDDRLWTYKLYGPLNFYGSISYRFCRNGQCGSADDNETVGVSPAGRITETAFLGQDIPVTINSWKWYENPENPSVVGNTITPRAGAFVTGIEFQPYHRPNYFSFEKLAFINTKSLGSNLVVITPTWSMSNIPVLNFALKPGLDPLWTDSGKMISQAREAGLNVSIFPTPQFPPSTDTSVSASTNFWRNASRDAAWWQTWFTRYRAFLVNYADLATQSGAQSIILGGEWVTPSLPGGLMPDGTPSNVPADAEAQWRSIIQDVRTHFKGQILWALPYENPIFTSAPVNIIRDTDAVYLLWSKPIATSSTATKTDYANEAARLLDTEVYPMSTTVMGKPVLLGLSYPSVAGAANGCVSNGAGGCLDFNALSRPNADIPAASLSMQTQADIYESMFIAVNGRPWVSGLVSRGYYPPALLQDKSTSIHGKPAANVLWYWYTGFLGIPR